MGVNYKHADFNGDGIMITMILLLTAVTGHGMGFSMAP
jgi:hypothetical protein